MAGLSSAPLELMARYVPPAASVAEISDAARIMPSAPPRRPDGAGCVRAVETGAVSNQAWGVEVGASHAGRLQPGRAAGAGE